MRTFNQHALTAAVIMTSLSFSAQSLTPSLKKYDPSDGFVAHEWGTFTSLRKSNGQVLSGLENEEEPLPAFVNNINYGYTYNPGTSKGIDKLYQIKHVTIKMETPVLYFYSGASSEQNVTVSVQFKNGCISQWYPARTAGENLPNITSSQLLSLDFSIQRLGWIRWDATIIPMSKYYGYTNPAAWETPQWNAARETASNLLKIKIGTVWNAPLNQFQKGESIEKYLFYRGIANFKEPIRVEFNTQGNLLITNSGDATISYAMVYEKRSDGKVLIWGSDSLPAGGKKTMPKPVSANTIDPAAEYENFVRHLVAAGLYEDEARAMMKTWKKSYFEHEGLKVFWIVPRKFTEEVLPLQLTPEANILNRVLVGRSEILSPEFEKQLAGMSKEVFNATYYYDRFIRAYQELLADSIPTTWTHEGWIEPEKTPVPEIPAKEPVVPLEVFPNPVTGNLTVNIKSPGTLKVFSGNGELVRILENARAGENSLTMETLPGGLYSVRVEFTDGSSFSKKVVKTD